MLFRSEIDGAALLREVNTAWTDIAREAYMAATLVVRIDADLTMRWWMAGAPPWCWALAARRSTASSIPGWG